MKKILLGSTALVAAGMIASAPASAKMKLSVGGYMEQWVGYVSQDDVGTADYSGVDVKSDSEVHFKGMTSSTTACPLALTCSSKVTAVVIPSTNHT